MASQSLERAGGATDEFLDRTGDRCEDRIAGSRLVMRPDRRPSTGDLTVQAGAGDLEKEEEFEFPEPDASTDIDLR